MIKRNNEEKDTLKVKEQLIQKSINGEQMLTSIIEHSNELFYIHDRNHKLIYASPQSLQMLGYTPYEMMIEWTRLVTDNPVNKMGYESTMKAIETGERQKPYLLELFKKDGNKVLFEIEESPLKDEEGKVIGIIGAARDITERWKAEEMLQRSEERFRALTENTSDWIWEVDQFLNFTYSSPKVKELLGYEPHELIGKTPFDLMPENEARRISEIAHSTMSSYAPFSSLENINIHKDGRKVILETSGIPIFDTNGNFSGYRGIDRDITDRKQMEDTLRQLNASLEQRVSERTAALKESEVRLKWAQEVGHLGSWELDLTTNKINWSDEAYRIFGLTPQEHAVTYEPILEMVHPDDRPAVDAAYSDMIREGNSSYEIEFRIVRKSDGEVRTVHIKYFSIMDESGQIIRLVGIVQDISELKRTEEELRERKRDLEIQMKNLEEMNAALNVLLKKRDSDKSEMEDKILLNMRQVVEPYIGKLKRSGLDNGQKTLVDILESNLKEITTSFTYSLSSKHLDMTPKEIKIANLIRQGMTSKEICEILGASDKVVAFHRHNIRKKLGLLNKKVNLTAYLQQKFL